VIRGFEAHFEKIKTCRESALPQGYSSVRPRHGKVQKHPIGFRSFALFSNIHAVECFAQHANFYIEKSAKVCEKPRSPYPLPQNRNRYLKQIVQSAVQITLVWRLHVDPARDVSTEQK